MAAWLKGLFGAKNAGPAPAAQAAAVSGSAAAPRSPVAAGSETTAQVHEMLRMALRDTARRHGIATDWLGIEVLSAGEGARAQHQVQLVLRHWDADFWLHASAFATAYMEEVRRFHADAAQRIRAVVWRVAPEAHCPLDQMPQSDYWDDESRRARDRQRARERAQNLLVDDDLDSEPPPQLSFAKTQPMAFEKTQPVQFDKTMPLRVNRPPQS